MPENSNSAPNEKIYSVSELNVTVDNFLKKQVGEVWVRGEITGLKRQASGHVYFTLKDASASISVAFFKFAAMKSTVKLEEGKQILVFGGVGVYKERGSYQMVAKFVLDEGAGALQQEFERLKKALGDEGLFSPERKVALPKLPSCVAFVTSPTGAVWHDFTEILRRRNWKGRAILFPAAVQGVNCGPEIVAGLAAADAHPDVELIVVGRGGGSLEDLWGFNTEPVVRAVAACQTPVVSAVGHQTDFTLCDFAADVRAETPSAAAELIVQEFETALQTLQMTARRWPQLVSAALERFRGRTQNLRSRLSEFSPKHLIQRHYQTLDHWAQRASGALKGRLQRSQDSLATLTARLNGLDPQRTLERGYAMVKDADGKLLTCASDVEELPKGAEVSLVFADKESQVSRS